jgi:hypothetical protein
MRSMVGAAFLDAVAAQPRPRRRRSKRARAGLAATPPVADASSIVYVKKGDVWLSSPDGKSRFRVTRGGGYESPTQDDRGRIVALRSGRFVRMTRTGRLLSRPFAAAVGRSGNVTAFGPWDPEVSPDGSKIAYWRGGRRDDAPLGGVTPYDMEDQTVISRSDRFTDPELFGVQRDYRDPSWVLGRELLVFNYGLHVEQVAFFGPRPAMPEPTLGEWFSETAVPQVGDGEIAPDGYKMALLAGDELGLVNIGLYRLQDGSPPAAPERVCAHNRPDGSVHYFDPSWSPQSNAIAFAQDAPGKGADGVYAMPVGSLADRGSCAGRPRLVARGAKDPDWGPAGVPKRRPRRGA